MVSLWVAEEKFCEELSAGKHLAPGETDYQHGCDKYIKAQKQEMYFRIYGKKNFAIIKRNNKKKETKFP